MNVLVAKRTFYRLDIESISLKNEKRNEIKLYVILFVLHQLHSHLMI